MTAIRFEPLKGSHDRAGFQSGVAELDDWFHERASQDQRRRVAQVYVALDGAGIVGFYSLNMFPVGLGTLPYDLVVKLPKYGAVPAAMIGRLARHVRAKGAGAGDLLLADAVRRVLGAAKMVGAYAIFVDAKDDRGRAFYESHGFIPLPSQPRRLFLPLQTAVQALEKAGTP